MPLDASRATPGTVATSGGELPDAASARVSHVLLLDRRRQLVLRRIPAPGLPHGGQLTSSIVAPVDAGESYEAAAAHAARAVLGRRAPELRYVDRTWIDRDGGRTFLGVFVALWDGDVPDACVAVPLPEVLRAARSDDRRLEGAFLRALRSMVGEAEMW